MSFLLRDPEELSPAMRKWALFFARVVTWFAPVLMTAWVGVAVAHFFFEVGNYPEARARQAVGALFLFLFLPVTGAIWFFAREQIKALRALDQDDDRRGRIG
jgi:hypothetical protein